MIYKLNEEKVLFTELENEGVLFDIETNEYFSLNETFASIILGIQEGLTEDDIIDKLCEEYKIDKETCKEEVSNCIKQIKEKGYII